MSAPTDRNYYTQRAAEERRLAQTAVHPGARESHLELARRYDELAETGIAPPLVVGAAQQDQQELR